jgi:nucleotide-binding universal stress UspA family protein
MADGTGANRRIVVGYDGSEASERALRWAFGQAQATGSVVEVVRAWYLPVTYGVPLVSSGEEIAAAVEQSLTAAVDKLSAEHPGVRVERQVVPGHAAAVLLERAKDADLLVVGSHGHGGFVGALLGSVSQHCIHHATCPVVVVRAER